ncbi:hypothetical protein FAM09_17490 [Niastella caeni]|uniref:Uncharacterized protein n=1 Tax=Niastella caeni TaxID=2569763 RepID=A0A4S8HTT6_9BACT|nr:hypothetical protein [Niastella caeni]THU38461.1 hypothetical protein FAM09_17490 [Niastella caeni]
MNSSIETFKQLLARSEIRLSEDQLSIILEITSRVSTDVTFRNDLMAAIQDEERLRLLSMSEILSEEAYNHKSEAYLEAALILHVIENFKWDARENSIYLAVIWYVAKKLGIDAKKLFNKVVDFSSAESGKHLLEFVNGPDYIKDLRSMGLKATLDSNDKISFEQLPPPWKK